MLMFGWSLGILVSAIAGIHGSRLRLLSMAEQGTRVCDRLSLSVWEQRRPIPTHLPRPNESDASPEHLSVPAG
jgi:hypothetical protein